MATFRARFMFATMLTVLIVASLAVGSRGIGAQDATPVGGDAAVALEGRPIHIHSGTCDELGEVVFPLNPVAVTEGIAEGNEDATTVETSVTTVDVALEDLLAEDFAINVHLSDAEIGTYIACGEIGGVRLPDDAIAIGLREQDNSDFAGIAYLAPALDGVAQTNISVFLAEDLTGDEDDLDDALGAPEGTPVS